ncbi:MAG: EpsG family protein [Candidatus Electrothrix sp. AUS4]|nr:EpsG family protein [Candidatus Electrothrix sp. AUS4]
MWPYWLMYSIPALVALSNSSRERSWPPWILLGVVFTICIGFRYHVGGDWNNYLPYYEREIGRAFTDPISGDPGYALLNRLMAQLDWKIYGVNLVCGLLFSTGLIFFCRGLYRSWLGFAVAVPYLIIVVAMGYARQGVALGLIFWGLAYLEKGRFLHYVFFVAVAASFHKTAIIMAPLGLFLYRQGWFFRLVAVGLLTFGLWNAFVEQDTGRMWNVYVEQQMHSQGAVIRVAMNAVAAVFLLRYWKLWRRMYPNSLLWLWMAYGAIACIFVVGFASTAVDRMALYLTPLQVVVFSRLPFLAQKKYDPETMTIWILFGYGTVLFVWLNFAIHARYWLPYRNILFE